MQNNKVRNSLIAGGAALLGLVGGLAAIASAQTTLHPASSTPTATVSQTQTAQADLPETPNDPADAPDNGASHGHAPLGGDGIVSSINGTTIVIAEESNEGGASYTVDASKATVTDKTGATASLSGIKVGDKIFVQGPVNGTSVAATSISLGHPEKVGKETNDTDGSAQSEASEPAGSTDAGE